jgi:hypothetical protein
VDNVWTFDTDNFQRLRICICIEIFGWIRIRIPKKQKRSALLESTHEVDHINKSYF